VTSLEFFKKWSGFLGQLITWRDGSEHYYTVCSKNSVDHNSKFVQDASRIFHSFITFDLIEHMNREGLHVCAEVISLQDQIHGSPVKKEVPVITVIGKQRNGEFPTFLTHRSTIEFCRLHNLPCDSSIRIEGRENCDAFLEQLTDARDLMDNASMDALITGCVVEKMEGTVDHADVLGNCLEGLVLHLTCDSGENVIRKYKFPRYTIRTMLFRTQFQKLRDFDEKAEISRFVDFWVVRPDMRQYWSDYAMSGFCKYREGFRSLDPLIGDHIALAEEMK